MVKQPVFARGGDLPHFKREQGWLRGNIVFQTTFEFNGLGLGDQRAPPSPIEELFAAERGRHAE